MAEIPPTIHPLTRDAAPEPADAAAARVVSGSGVARLWNAFSDPSERFHAGYWQAEPGILSVTYSETELCVLTEGRVRLTDTAGASAEYGPGEAFVIAAGFTGTWESIGRVTKVYAILMPES